MNVVIDTFINLDWPYLPGRDDFLLPQADQKTFSKGNKLKSIKYISYS